MTGDPWRVVSEVGDRMELACGCVMDIVGDTFVVVPCSSTCPAYRYVVAENRRAAKPLEVLLTDLPRSKLGTHEAVAGEVNRAERRRRRFRR